MVPYVQKSFYKHFIDGLEFCEGIEPESTIIVTKYGNNKQLPLDSEDCQTFQKAYKYAMSQTKKELDQAVEGLLHNLNTLQSRSGSQLPFSSINFGTCTSTEGRMVIKSLLEGSIKGVGKHHKTPIFPCSIFQMKTGINRKPGDPNYDLFKLAIKSTSQRLYPNYANCDWSNQLKWEKADAEGRQKVINELSNEEYEILKEKLKVNDEARDFLGLEIKDEKIIANIIQKPETLFSTMGCRTVNGLDMRFFAFYKTNIYNFINGKEINKDMISGVQKDGRGNVSPVSIILPTLAMEAGCDVEKFMELLSKKIDEAKDTLLERFERICSQSADAAKFMYENHTMAGYIPEEGIRSAMQHGTNVIGQLGDAEALQLLVGCNQTKPEGMELLKRIEELYNEKCNQFKKEYGLNFGVYYTPAENLCYTACEKFKAKYGEIENVSDKGFFTNSMHVPVWEKVSVFEKINIESQLTGYSNAGCITYVEFDATAKNNLGALEKVINYAMDKDIPYFAINVPNDACEDCGYTDEIGEECPICGGKNIKRLRRVTGYLTGDYKTAFNLGKQKEVELRFQHTKKV